MVSYETTFGMAKHNTIGRLGEALSENWLVKQGFEVLERNYRKKWGEIDLVARETSQKNHFIEVKTISHETREALENAVSRETWRPEEKVDWMKQKRLGRAIESWLLERNYEGEWQIDVLSVRLVPREKLCTVRFLANVIFE